MNQYNKQCYDEQEQYDNDPTLYRGDHLYESLERDREGIEKYIYKKKVSKKNKSQSETRGRKAKTFIYKGKTYSIRTIAPMFQYTEAGFGSLVKRSGGVENAIKKAEERLKIINTPCPVCGSTEKKGKRLYCSKKCARVHYNGAFRPITYKRKKKQVGARPEKCLVCVNYMRDDKCPVDLYADMPVFTPGPCYAPIPERSVEEVRQDTLAGIWRDK